MITYFNFLNLFSWLDKLYMYNNHVIGIPFWLWVQLFMHSVLFDAGVLPLALAKVPMQSLFHFGFYKFPSIAFLRLQFIYG